MVRNVAKILINEHFFNIAEIEKNIAFWYLCFACSYKINSELAQNNKSLTNDDLNSTLQDSSRDVINSSSFLVQKAEEHKKRRSLLSRMLTGNYYPGCYPFQFPPRGSTIIFNHPFSAFLFLLASTVNLDFGVLR